MWPLLASTPPDFDSARTAGAIVGTLIPLVAALKCFSIMRRPTTSTLCALSLGLVMGAWVVLQITSIIIKAFTPPFSITLLLGALGFVVLLAALVIAIVGLSTYDSRRFLQGKAQAIWGIILSSGLLIIFLTNTIQGFRQTRSGSWANDSLASAKPNERFEDSKLNFSIQPSSNWFSINAKTLTPLATCAYRRRGQDAYSVVVAEYVGGRLPIESLVEITKNNLAAGGKVISQTSAEVPIGNLSFTKLSSVVHLDELRSNLYYEHWLLTKGDFSWQIITWGAPQTQSMIEREGRELAASFRILDNGSGSSGSFLDEIHLAQGYTTKLAGLGWKSSNAPNIPLAHTVAERLNEGLLVVPLNFATEADAAVPPLDALGHAGLNMLGITPSEVASHPTKEWSPPSGTGLEVQADTVIDNEPFRYIMRIARGDKMAHLLVGWYPTAKGDEALVRRSLDAIALEPPIGKPAELSEPALRSWAVILNSIGLHYYHQNDRPEATRWFRRAFQNYTKDLAVLQNLLSELIEEEQLQEARSLLETHRSNFPDKPSLLVQEARLQAAEQNLDAANETFHRAIKEGHTDENDWIAWLMQLSGAERYDLALSIADAYTAKRPTLTARRWLAQAAKGAGEYQRATELLDKLAKEYPSNQEIAYELAEVCNSASDYNRAGEMAEALIKKNPKDLRARTIRGWSQVGRKWYREAKSTFEAIASEKADYPEIQDSLKFVSALLGQGDNSAVKTPIASVPVPEELQKVIDGHSFPETSKEGGISVQRLLRIKSFHFVKDKPMRTTITQRIKVLNAEGANELSSFQFSFDPLFERIHLNSLEVFDAQGKHVAHGSAEDAYVLDASQDTHDQEKVLHLPVPSVSPGCTVAVTVTTETLSSVEHFPYTANFFTETELNAVTVTGDIAAVSSELALAESITSLKEPDTLVWYGKSLPPFHSEPYSVPLNEQMPSLVLVGEEGSWEELAKDYLRDINQLLEPDDDTRKLANVLTKDLQTDQERIDALAHYVQKQIAYRAIEFGVRARRPNSASATLKNRYGDCKDQSLLLYQLLRAEKIDCNLALVHNYFPTKPKLPSLDQFNHMVLHVPSLGKDRLVDPTDKYLNLSHWQADNLWHSQALILDEDQSRLLPLSNPADGSNLMESERSITPEGDHWKVEEVFTAHGYAASWLRVLFAGMDVKHHDHQAQNLLAQNGEAQLHKFKFENLDDSSKPAVLHLTYTARNAIRHEGGKTTGTVPAFFERHYIDLQFIPDRKTAFLLRYSNQFRSKVTLNLPSTLEPSSLTALTQDTSGPFCKWRTSGKSKETGSASYDLQFSFESTTGRHPAEAYSDCRNAWEQPRLWWNRPISWATAAAGP